MALRLYHEKQQGTLCAVHATNNLLGAAVFTREDFVRLKESIPEEPAPLCGVCLRGCPQCCCRRCRTDEGNFGVNVIMMALSGKNITLQYWDARDTNVDGIMEMLEKDECVGALLHTTADSHSCTVAALIRCIACCFGKNGHWSALRADVGSDLFLLDSKLAAPKRYKKDRAKAMLAVQLKVNTTIILASKEVAPKARAKSEER